MKVIPGDKLRVSPKVKCVSACRHTRDSPVHEIIRDSNFTKLGQFVIVVPSHDLVIVRRGLDDSPKGLNQWALVQEVVKAVNQARPASVLANRSGRPKAPK